MNSFICWIGGKRALRKKILEEFPERYDRYVEVFGGAGWVLFGREENRNVEVLNDINGELINLYRIIKYHPEALQKELNWILMSREQFFEEREKESNKLTDIQRAARMFILIKESFGADCRSFGVRPKGMIKASEYLQQVSKRLEKVVIENLDFEHLIRTYDKKETLFYLDPPYYDAEKYYPDRFNPEDHIRLRDILKRIKGKFILSYNDCPTIRELYSEFSILNVERIDNLVIKKEVRKYAELIIKNY